MKFVESLSLSVSMQFRPISSREIKRRKHRQNRLHALQNEQTPRKYGLFVYMYLYTEVAK